MSTAKYLKNCYRRVTYTMVEKTVGKDTVMMRMRKEGAPSLKEFASKAADKGHPELQEAARQWLSRKWSQKEA